MWLLALIQWPKNVIWEAGSFHFSDLTSLTRWFSSLYFSPHICKTVLQIQMPLTSILKKGVAREEGTERSFPLIRKEKKSQEIPRFFITSYQPKLGHMTIVRGKVGKISGQEERSDTKGPEK